MLHLFQHNSPRQFGGGLLFNGLLCVFFGLAILAAPDLLAFFVAAILIIIGVSILSAWWKVRNWK